MFIASIKYIKKIYYIKFLKLVNKDILPLFLNFTGRRTVASRA